MIDLFRTTIYIIYKDYDWAQQLMQLMIETSNKEVRRIIKQGVLFEDGCCIHLCPINAHFKGQRADKVIIQKDLLVPENKLYLSNVIYPLVTRNSLFCFPNDIEVARQGRGIKLGLTRY